MYLPDDVKIVIYRYLHEMKMCAIRKELKQHMEFLEDCLHLFRLYIPQLFMDRFYKCNLLKNSYIRLKINKYVHSKKMAKCLPYLINPIPL